MKKLTVLLCITLAMTAFAANSYYPIDGIIWGLLDTNGFPNAAGTVTIYDGGTTNARNCYTTPEGTAAANPLTLDSLGRGTLYTTAGWIKVLVKDDEGTTIFTADDVLVGVAPADTLEVEEIEATDSDGIKMYDDGANLALFLEDGGNIGLGGNSNPGNKVSCSGTLEVFNAGASTNSYPLLMSADSAGNACYSGIKTVYGADPYMQIGVSAAAGSALTYCLNIKDTSFHPVTANAFDFGSSGNEFKDFYLLGELYSGTIEAANNNGVNIMDNANNVGVYVEDGGMVGIGGTADPSSALDVTGTTETTAGLIVDTNTLYVNGTTNRVGIGTASPAQLLHLQSAAGMPTILLKSTAGSTSDAYISATNATFVGGTVYDLGIRASGEVWIGGNNDTTPDIATLANKVGIGTTSPGVALEVNGGIASKGGAELTIASGAVTVTHNMHTIDTESDAALDTVEVINGGADGQVLVLIPASAARTVVVKGYVGGSDNIIMTGNITMNNDWDTITLIHKGGYWFKIGAEDNGS